MNQDIEINTIDEFKKQKQDNLISILSDEFYKKLIINKKIEKILKDLDNSLDKFPLNKRPNELIQNVLKKIDSNFSSKDKEKFSDEIGKYIEFVENYIIGYLNIRRNNIIDSSNFTYICHEIEDNKKKCNGAYYHEDSFPEILEKNKSTKPEGYVCEKVDGLYRCKKKSTTKKTQENTTVGGKRKTRKNKNKKKGGGPLEIKFFDAVIKNNTELVLSILERGVDINTKHDDDDEVDWMEEGYTALHYACHHRIENMVDLLLGEGADVEITESTGKKPLHIACRYGYIDIIEALLHNPFRVRVDINMKKGSEDGESPGATPLHEVILDYGYLGNKFEVIEFLLENGADVNAVDDNGETPLHYVIQSLDSHSLDAYEKSIEIANFLINEGADVNISNADGNTPLHYLIQGEIIYKIEYQTHDKTIELIKTIINKSGDYDAKNNEGKTPLDYFYDDEVPSQEWLEFKKVILNHIHNLPKEKVRRILLEKGSEETNSILSKLPKEVVKQNIESYLYGGKRKTKKKRKKRKNKKKIIGRGAIDDEEDEELDEIPIPNNSGIDITLLDKTNDELEIEKGKFINNGLKGMPKFQIRIGIKEETSKAITDKLIFDIFNLIHNQNTPILDIKPILISKYCNFEMYSPDDKTDDMSNIDKVNNNFLDLVKDIFKLELFDNKANPDLIESKTKERLDDHIKYAEETEIKYINSNSIELRKLTEEEKDDLIREKKSRYIIRFIGFRNGLIQELIKYIRNKIEKTFMNFIGRQRRRSFAPDERVV